MLRRYPLLVFALALSAAVPARSQEPAPDELRARLTEHEDENRVPDPWSVDLWGYPLTLAGELETALEYVDKQSLGEPVTNYDRLFWQEGLQLESFYTRGTVFSLFVQSSLIVDYDIENQVGNRTRDVYVERGEMWVYSEDIAATGFSVEFGRLDFEDERRWWWDDDRDAARISYENGRVDAAVAIARELAPKRSDRSWVDPDENRVLRLIAEISWDWWPEHALEFFALRHDDRSRRQPAGAFVKPDRSDESDARLTWLGARAIGGWELPSGAILGYWLDTGFVDGDEWLAEFTAASPHGLVVESTERHHVRGWAIDAGVNGAIPLAFEPRLFLGAAFGSGDRNPDTGTDHAYRQTGIQENESGFGGVQRFRQYGILLDPELSNLIVVTVGTGISLLNESSIDIIYHHYRMVEPATALREAALDPTLDDRDRTLGDAVDVVLALEEWSRLEIEVTASAFRANSAFAVDAGEWAFGGFIAVRIAF